MVLGVDLRVAATAEQPVADARMTKALCRGARLINPAIPLTFRRQLWCTRIAPPTGMLLKDLVATFKKVVCSHKMGSAALRRILEGHGMDVQFMAGMHALRACGAKLGGPMRRFGSVALAHGSTTLPSSSRGIGGGMRPRPLSSLKDAAWTSLLKRPEKLITKSATEGGISSRSSARLREGTRSSCDNGASTRSESRRPGLSISLRLRRVVLLAAHSTAFYRKRGKRGS